MSPPEPRVGAYSELPRLRARRIGLTLADRDVEFVDWGFYEPEPWRNYRHRHSYFEVCLAYAGTGRFSTDAEDVDIEAGTAFLARPGVIHEIESSTENPLGITFWSLAVGPGSGTPDWLAGFADPTAPTIATDASGLATIVDLLAGAVHDRSPGERSDMLARTLAVETIHTFARPRPGVDDPGAPEIDNSGFAVATMHRYLRDNLSQPIQVRDVAAQVHLSERHAARIFAAATGESLLDHLRSLRLERAADRLLSGTDTLTAIADDAGFYDRRHFSRSFRLRYGVSPTEFREAAGTIHDR